MTTPNAQAHAQGRKGEIHEIVIRSWPKVIFLYPTMFAGFFCGLAQHFTTGQIESDFAFTAGLIFFVVLALNMLVLSFEFSRFKTLAIFGFFLALIFFLLYLGTRWDVLGFLKEIFDHFRLRASSSFYLAIATYLLFTLGAVFVTTRFNYWVIRSNELVHKEGFLGDVKRFPSPNLKMTKEICDVFEYALLGSGRIVLFPASEKQAIVLDHVLRVNAKEKAIQELLSTISVEVEPHEHGEDASTPVG